jgi:hypothetical protein
MSLNQGFLDACKEHFEKGNRWALMQAIDVCATYREPLPDWAAAAYREAFESVRTGRAKSWDAVFGKPYPKGSHGAAIYKRQTVMWPIFNAVLQFRAKDKKVALDTALFERVGKIFGIGKTQVSEFYYEAKKRSDSIESTSANPKKIAGIKKIKKRKKSLPTRL